MGNCWPTMAGPVRTPKETRNEHTPRRLGLVVWQGGVQAPKEQLVQPRAGQALEPTVVD